jgi:phosphatidylglycerophosphate synthase
VITEATLYLATAGDVEGALLDVAGQPVAFRAIAGALRAGCRRISVPARFRGTDVERAIAANPRARAATFWRDGGDGPPAGASLLVPAAALVPAADLHRVVHGQLSTVLAPADASAPVVAADGHLTRALWPEIRAERPLAPTLGPMLAASSARRASGGWYIHVTSASEARRAERLLYRTLGSPIDTPLDTAVHRRLARPLTRLALALGVTANQVSVASLLVGLVAVWGFWHATPSTALVGFFLYALSVVLDHSDGEVARLTLSESRLGEWLDLTGDTVVHALLVLAMGVTAQAGRVGIGLGMLAAIGVVASAVIAKTSPRGEGGGVGGLLDALGNRDGFYAMLVIFVLVLTAVPHLLPGLMVLISAGSHAYWVIRLGHRPSGEARRDGDGRTLP